jgi:hypothetical protein
MDKDADFSDLIDDQQTVTIGGQYDDSPTPPQLLSDTTRRVVVTLSKRWWQVWRKTRTYDLGMYALSGQTTHEKVDPETGETVTVFDVTMRRV